MFLQRIGHVSAASALLIGSAGLFASGCSNPADDKYQAEASPAKAKPAEAPKSDAAPAPESSAAATPEAAAGTKTVKAVAAESKVEFTGSKVTGKHDGGFKTFTAEAVVDTAKKSLIDFKATIDMNSTWSDSENLTGHLKNQDFFDVPKFPTSTFETVEVKAGSDAKVPGSNTLITGNLTLHGVTKAISFPAKVEVADTGAVSLNTEFAINRKDFGIVYGGKADDLIRDEVVIRLAVKAQ